MSGTNDSTSPEAAPEPDRRMFIGLVIVGVGLLLAAAIVIAKSFGGESAEDRARDAVERGFRAWVEAEAGDESACDDAAESIVMGGEDVKERCLAEVGSNPGSRVIKVEVSDVELDGNTGTAELSYEVEDEDKTESGTSDVQVRRVNGVWMFDWT